MDNFYDLLSHTDDKLEPCLYILDERYLYGCEFYGAQPIIGHTLTTDKCYLAISQALALQKGAIISGSTTVGKTETIKVSIKVILYKASLMGCTRLLK